MPDLDHDRDLADELQERRRARVVCPRCDGDGAGNGWDRSCLDCRGTGEVRPGGDAA